MKTPLAEPWYIDFERVGSCVFALREPPPEAAVLHGAAFEDVCLGADHTSYRAILQCQLGRLRFLLRCEVDGQVAANDQADVASLSALMSSVSMQNDTSVMTFPGTPISLEVVLLILVPTGSAMRVIKRPFTLQLPSTNGFVELKSKNSEFFGSSDHIMLWPQMFFSGTPTAVWGFRERNRIIDIQEMTIHQVLQNTKVRSFL